MLWYLTKLYMLIQYSLSLVIIPFIPAPKTFRTLKMKAGSIPCQNRNIITYIILLFTLVKKSQVLENNAFRGVSFCCCASYVVFIIQIPSVLLWHIKF